MALWVFLMIIYLILWTEGAPPKATNLVTVRCVVRFVVALFRCFIVAACVVHMLHILLSYVLLHEQGSNLWLDCVSDSTHTTFRFSLLIVLVEIAALLYGVFLVWKTRNMPTLFNEGRYIAAVICNTLLIGGTCARFCLFFLFCFVCVLGVCVFACVCI